MDTSTNNGVKFYAFRKECNICQNKKNKKKSNV